MKLRIRWLPDYFGEPGDKGLVIGRVDAAKPVRGPLEDKNAELSCCLFIGIQTAFDRSKD